MFYLFWVVLYTCLFYTKEVHIDSSPERQLFRSFTSSALGLTPRAQEEQRFDHGGLVLANGHVERIAFTKPGGLSLIDVP